MGHAESMLAEFLIILSVTKKHKNKTQIDIRDAFHHLAQVAYAEALEGEVSDSIVT